MNISEEDKERIAFRDKKPYTPRKPIKTAGVGSKLTYDWGAFRSGAKRKKHGEI